MTAVTILQSAPGLGSFGTIPVGKTSNTFVEGGQQTRGTLTTRVSGVQSYDCMNVAQIKTAAQDVVQKTARNASAKSLIITAGAQYREGNEHEGKSELKKSFGAYCQAAALAQMVINVRQSDPAVQREIDDFFKIFDGDRLKQVEEKLKLAETASSSFPPSPSVADRMRSLKDNGLDITSKRISSRNFSEVATTSSPKTSPLPLLLPSLPLLPFVKTTSSDSSNSALASPRTLVSPSQLGPPSPSSSPSLSPHLDTSDPYELTNFPPIEELDRPAEISLHSSPSIENSSCLRNSESSVIHPSLPSCPLPRPYPCANERPPSAPAVQLSNSLSSLPASPRLTPSHLKSPEFPSSIYVKDVTKKSFIPVKDTATVSELSEYLRENRNLLFLDVRCRSEFEKGHILSPAVVCIEPFNLLATNVGIQELEEAIMSKSEQGLFSNRDKFEIIIMYDDSSTGFSGKDTPLSILAHLIGGRSSPKMLRRDPMLLVGGLQAWREHVKQHIGTQIPVSLFNTTATNNCSQPDDKMLQTAAFGQSTEVSFGHPSHTRFAAEVSCSTVNPSDLSSLSYYSSPNVVSSSILHARSADNVLVCPTPPKTSFGGASITYPPVPKRALPSSPQPLGSATIYPPNVLTPPLASVNPSHLSRKRSEYFDSHGPFTGFSRTSVDYPRLSSPPGPRPPPPAASSVRERQAIRPYVYSPSESTGMATNTCRVRLDWPQARSTPRGLVNLGNTCWMNSIIQCLNATLPFVNYFLDGRWKLAVDANKGRLTFAFAQLVNQMKNAGEQKYIVPNHFHDTICHLMPHFEKGKQHDSQEFLGSFLDRVDEDLKTLTKTEPLTTRQSGSKTPHTSRDDASIVPSCFQSECSSRLQCSVCETTSVTHEHFNFLQLSLPSVKDKHHSLTLSVYNCLDEFFREEIMEKENQWLCPKCKKSRKASKKMSLTRPPAVLVLHLKRYTLVQDARGERMVRNDTFVDSPLEDIDLSRYVNISPENGHIQPSQPHSYRYRLYGVTNHCGSESLDRGHYTALISTNNGWLRFSDTQISGPINPREVVSSEAYVLFYRRLSP